MTVLIFAELHLLLLVGLLTLQVLSVVGLGFNCQLLIEHVSLKCLLLRCFKRVKLLLLLRLHLFLLKQLPLHVLAHLLILLRFELLL